MEREMRQVLAELELLSHGKVTAYNSSGRGESDAVVPQGEACPPHIEFAQRWEQERDDARRQRVLEEARACLQAWKKREAPPQDDGSDFEQWVIDDGEGYSVDQVASKFGIAPARVARIRLRAADPQREPEFGLPVEKVTKAVRKERSRERVLNLASQGLTLRQIHDLTDVPRETVRRWMRAA